MLTLDVGCGWHEGQKRRGDVGLDLHRGMCDVVGDAQHLPFRDEVFDRILLYAILEHLDRPSKCLEDVRRVAKKGAPVEIRIPVDSRSLRIYLKRMVVEFPVATASVLKALWSAHKYGKAEGAPHKNRIQPRHISPFLKIELTEIRGTHAWFHGKRGKVLRRLVKKPLPGAWKYYYIIARRENNADTGKYCDEGRMRTRESKVTARRKRLRETPQVGLFRA